MKTVPKCENCQHLDCVDEIYKSYYCIKAMNRSLGVDAPPFRSPKWCPLRLKERKVHISELYDRLYLKDKRFVITLYHEFAHDIATSVCTYIFMNILKRCEARNIKVWGSCRYDKYNKNNMYVLDYESIIFYLTECLNHYMYKELDDFIRSHKCNKYDMYRHYDLLLESDER